ncbi:MAG: Glutamine transport ATP-binding protein GlnQ [Chlamydiia bacterium]|nr:Glutamine transport ATP-binding protein GlnQ [Chlamydiia bacterium]
MLCIKNLSKKDILANINLNLMPGEIAIILGASGAGKSTLLRAICGLETFEEGSILFKNKPLDSAGMVHQHFFLFEHLSVKKNLTLVLENQTDPIEEKTQELLHIFDLEKEIDKLAIHLSGGQKQRLAIAQAIAANPQVLCMDEPTSALDPIRTRKVALIIQKLASMGLPILISTHDLTLIEMIKCTVHLIHEGSIVETIPSSEFMNKKDSSLIHKFSKGKL